VNVRYGDDALAEDSPVVTAVTRLEKQWVYYQYGFAASLGIQTLGPLNVSGRYFRVEVPGSNLEHGRWIHQDWHSQSWNVTGHNPELFNRPFWQDVVFRSDRPDIRITHKTAADLDSDGNDELVFATDRNELLVLAADGSVRWKYKLGAPVTGLICEDLKGDASRQVLCTTHDTALHMFSHDGKTHTRIDKLPASGLNSLGLYVEPSGDRGLFVGTYHHPMKLDAAGDALTTASGSGFYQDTMPDVSWDLTGDGVPDLVLRENVWGLVSLIDGAKFSALASHSTRHLGRGLGVVPWPVRGSSRVNRFLVIAESGLAMLEATGEAGEPLFGDAATVVGGIRSVFSIPIAPVVAWSVADLDGDGAREIVVASLNGAVMVFDGTGRTIASTIAAGEVSDLAVLERGDNPSMIVTATNAGLRRFDADLKLVSDGGPQTANCRAIGAVRANGHHIALCLFANGDVARLVE
jgi:hypothetical protein